MREYENANQSLQSGAEQPVLLYRIPDAIRVTGLSRSAIYRLINDGELQTVHVASALSRRACAP
jgi:predicted DNA-binding transcriptional regulator AlpA